MELKEVKLREGYYVMDPKKAVDMVDENTICVAVILGSTLTREFENVKLLNDLLAEKNKKTGLEPSIIHFNSKFVHENTKHGYRKVIRNCMESAKRLREGLEKTGRFDIISKDKGIPLVAFSIKDKNSLTFELSKALRHNGRTVPAYTMPANVEHMTVLQVVVREDLRRNLIEKLVSHIKSALSELTEAPFIPRISFTVEVKPSESGDDKEALHTPQTSIQGEQDKTEIS
ncbi:hypothetical protein F0562_034483 [Nyssa sinensis]|uniref:glutamate decarboxylase n=1 Tax=Nyssa sinensis TaxID=561372 RepID=A0A5J5AFY7_9ASTE|nr:hypothetical protein F0562_034483 [Nyssa sinensis]